MWSIDEHRRLSLAEEIRRAILRPVNLRSPSVAAPPCHPGPACLRRRFQARNPRFLAAMRKSGQRVHRRAAHILIPIGQKVRQDRQGTWRSARAGFRRARAQPRPYRLGRDPAFCAALLFRRPGSGPDDLAPLSAYRTRVDSRSRNGFVSLLGVRGWQHHAWRGVVWDRRILPDRQWPHELPNSTTLVGSVPDRDILRRVDGFLAGSDAKRVPYEAAPFVAVRSISLIAGRTSSEHVAVVCPRRESTV